MTRLCCNALHAYIQDILTVAGEFGGAIKATAIPFIHGCYVYRIPPSECWAVLHSDIVIEAHAYDGGLTFTGGRG